MADVRIWTLDRATSFQLLQYVLELVAALPRPFLERAQVGDVLGKALPNGLVDQIRDGAVRFRSLQPECSVNLLIEVHSRSLGFSHGDPA